MAGALISRRDSSENIHSILQDCYADVVKLAPKWTSNATGRKPDFTPAEAALAQRLTGQPDKGDFLRATENFLWPKIKNEQFSEQTKVGWFLAVVTNTLAQKNQHDLITDQLLPTLTHTALEKGWVHSLFGRAMPAMSEHICPAAREDFSAAQRKCVQTLADKSNPAYRTALNLMHFMGDVNGIGDYIFKTGNAQQAAILHDTLPCTWIVRKFDRSFENWAVAACLTNMLDKATPERRHELATTLYTQKTPELLIASLCKMAQTDTAPTAMNLSRALLSGLQGEDKATLASALTASALASVLDHCAIFNPELSARFISALPQPHAAIFVRAAATEALHFSLREGPDYWWQLKYADHLHRMVPKSHWPIIEAASLEALEAKPNDAQVLHTAAVVLRGILAHERSLSTREVDFIHLPFAKDSSCYSHLAHIKPQAIPQQGSLILYDAFAGTLADFNACSRKINEEIDAQREGLLRDWPVNRQQVGPDEKTTPLIARLWTTEQTALTDTAPAQQSLQTALRRRLKKSAQKTAQCFIA